MQSLTHWSQYTAPTHTGPCVAARTRCKLYINFSDARSCEIMLLRLHHKTSSWQLCNPGKFRELVVKVVSELLTLSVSSNYHVFLLFRFSYNRNTCFLKWGERPSSIYVSCHLRISSFLSWEPQRPAPQIQLHFFAKTPHMDPLLIRRKTRAFSHELFYIW